jgi:hypothetical protein
VLFDGSAAEADGLRDLVIRHGWSRQYAAVVVVTDDQTWAVDGFSPYGKIVLDDGLLLDRVESVRSGQSPVALGSGKDDRWRS